MFFNGILFIREGVNKKKQRGPQLNFFFYFITCKESKIQSALKRKIYF